MLIITLTTSGLRGTAPAISLKPPDAGMQNQHMYGNGITGLPMPQAAGRAAGVKHESRVPDTSAGEVEVAAEVQAMAGGLKSMVLKTNILDLNRFDADACLTAVVNLMPHLVGPPPHPSRCRVRQLQPHSKTVLLLLASQVMTP